MDENNNQENVEQGKTSKKILKKWWFWTIIGIATVILLILTILFFRNKIPSKYYGTYVRYYYWEDNEYITTYKISPLKIKYTYEYTVDGEKKIEEKNIEYYKKGDDLVIKGNEYEKYMILDDDCLYINSNKDISSSKKYGWFYWNVKSDNADLYCIEAKADQTIDAVEKAMNTWVKEVYKKGLEDSNFYITSSDEETDKTNLNTYEIKYNAVDGELSLYYDRKTQKLNTIHFIRNSFEKNLSESEFFKVHTMLVSLMYVLGNSDNLQLNIDIGKTDDYTNAKKDLEYRVNVVEEHGKLIENQTTKDTGFSLSLENDKYDIAYDMDTLFTTFSINLK